MYPWIPMIRMIQYHQLNHFRHWNPMYLWIPMIRMILWDRFPH
jgi:hypothetical protein